MFCSDVHGINLMIFIKDIKTDISDPIKGKFKYSLQDNKKYGAAEAQHLIEGHLCLSYIHFEPSFQIIICEQKQECF